VKAAFAFLTCGTVGVVAWVFLYLAVIDLPMRQFFVAMALGDLGVIWLVVICAWWLNRRGWFKE